LTAHIQRRSLRHPPASFRGMVACARSPDLRVHHPILAFTMTDPGFTLRRVFAYVRVISGFTLELRAVSHEVRRGVRGVVEVSPNPGPFNRPTDPDGAERTPAVTAIMQPVSRESRGDASRGCGEAVCGPGTGVRLVRASRRFAAFRESGRAVSPRFHFGSNSPRFGRGTSTHAETGDVELR
jgi:hypothetical protein